LGSLANLQSLDLSSNQLSGGLPAQFGSLANLQTLYLDSNPLKGSLPLTLTALTHLTTFADYNTLLCDPRDAAFQAWRASVTGWTSPGQCYTITGHVNRKFGPLAGVTITAGSAYSAVSGADGAYTLAELIPGSYTLTPALSNYSFTPPSIFVSVTNTDVAGNDFFATRPFSNCANQAEIPVAECDALVALYNSTGGASWYNHTYWLVTDTPSDWHGVTVSSRTVTALSLFNNHLGGGIPAALGSLANLEFLDLSFNQLNGGVPTQLGSLAALRYLDLSSNPLGGSIPSQLGGLVNLQSLVLENDQLSGNIPAGLGSLANLEQLGLSHNQLSGSIPPQLIGLTDPFFSTLDLSYNQLSGNIPPELGSMANLQVLNLSHNQLHGSIPSQLGGLANLSNLILSNNQLSGGIPTQLSGLPILGTLDLSSNQLNGGIPAQLGGLALLNTLNLSSNQLSGGIPPQLSGLTQLLTLNLSSNQLTGSIPPQLGSLSKLMNLILSSNLLTGSLPSQLSAITNLYVLNVSTNPLSLRIPLAFTYLTHLTTFNALDTWLCKPQDAAFLAWVASVPSWTSPGLCHTISGQVTKPGGVVPNVTISDGAVHSTTTDVTGSYTLLDLPPASYTLTASLPGHAFIPTSQDVTIINTDITGADFHEVFSISGRITVAGNPLAGVIVSDNSGHSTFTAADGTYTLTGLVPGDYIVTPTMPGCTFTPPSLSVTITNTNVSGQDFIVTLNIFLPLIQRH
jgi:Leucine-rich repeat (LRR) protein